MIHIRKGLKIPSEKRTMCGEDFWGGGYPHPYRLKLGNMQEATCPVCLEKMLGIRRKALKTERKFLG